MAVRWKRLAGVAALATAVGACKLDPRIEERQLVVYSPRSCPVAQSEAFSVIYGYGDFDTSRAAISSLYLRDVGTTLSELPAETRSVIADVSHLAESVSWRGIASVPPSGSINVLVWPNSETCRLTRNVEPRTNGTLGVFGRHLMVAGGKLTGQVPHTFVGDLSTGILESLDFGLGTRRSFPTITAFRTTPDQDPSPALVAGGEDPDTQTPLGTAELYLPKPGVAGDLGDFAPERIDLSEPRTKHGAVVLASGETLLVGGVGQFGAPLATMEIVDPKKQPPERRIRTNGVALLSVARANPIVLRLASGEIMVAGGTDRSHAEVSTIEWFSADASVATKRPVDLVTGRERAFVPLAAGGALAVVAPKDTSATDFQSVWVISADGSVEPGLPIDPATLDTVRLFEGTDGAPVLWTGQRWLRWQPWFGAFQPIPDAPAPAPADRPKMAAIANGDNGLALWLDTRIDGQLYVTGYRFATRSPFGNVSNPLLVESPLGLAPDRVTGTPGSSIRFVDGSGLELGPGSSAFVTDVTYADVTVDIDGGATPSIVLRQENGRELEVGGVGCAFALIAKKTVHVERIATQVTVKVDDGETRVCPSTLDVGARIAIGVRGSQGSGTSVARNLRIVRR